MLYSRSTPEIFIESFRAAHLQGGVPQKDHVALAQFLKKLFLTEHPEEDLEFTRVWKNQIYFQIHDDFQQKQEGVAYTDLPERHLHIISTVLRICGFSQWICRLTKHVSQGHVYTEFVLERRSSIVEGSAPYAISELHGKLPGK